MLKDDGMWVAERLCCFVQFSVSIKDISPFISKLNLEFYFIPTICGKPFFFFNNKTFDKLVINLQ